MRIYLTQHGEALAKDVDRERPLSEQGRADVQRLAEFLRDKGVRVEHIWHSGKTRAEQTAALIADAILPDGQPEARPGLGPNDLVEPLAYSLGTWPSDLALVGHLPFLRHLACLLLDSEPDPATLAFEPGSMACLERDAAGHWALLWMLRPEQLASQPPLSGSASGS
jgi:phosphohistidine phosphatase